MKKKLLIPSIIVLLTAFAVAGVFLLMQLYIADKSFDTLDRALKSLIDLQASAAYNGYFAWTKMYDLVMQGNLTEANALADEIPKSFPLVASAEIMQGVPPEENFVVGADGELLRIVYSIRDDDEFRTAPNAVAVTIIQASKLLDIVSPNGFKIDMTGGRKTTYGIHVSANLMHISLWNIIAMVLLTILFASLLIQRYVKKTAFFLDTRGLESIIYLFEQTEKMSASHSRNVAVLALFLGKKLGLRGKRLRNLYVAALLHDIGKISVPTNVIAKAGRLDSKEYMQIKQHPVISARILRSFKEFERLSQIVLYHHEREDGSGYPEGLTGKDIPLESKIIAVVDVFEALVGERPYRNPIHPFSAFEKLKKMPLDQRIVKVLIDNYSELNSFQPPRWVLSYSPWLLGV